MRSDFWRKKSAGVNTQSNNYWTSTTYASNPTNAWNVNFNDGNTNNNNKTNANYVRCVRGKLIFNPLCKVVWCDNCV